MREYNIVRLAMRANLCATAFATIARTLSCDAAPAENAAAFAFTHPLRYLGRCTVGTVRTRCLDNALVPSARRVSETFPVTDAGAVEPRAVQVQARAGESRAASKGHGPGFARRSLLAALLHDEAHSSGVDAYAV